MFTRFLFKTHESIKVILAILLSVIIITSFSSCAIKNNSEQNHLVYYTLNDKDSLSWIIVVQLSRQKSKLFIMN